MEVQPDAEGISIFETDLEVDFAPPKGYVEPTPPTRPPPPTMASKWHIDQLKQDVILPGQDGSSSAGSTPRDPGSVPAPFKGFGQTLSGKKTKGKKDKPITPRDPHSMIRSTKYVHASLTTATRRLSRITRS